MRLSHFIKKNDQKANFMNLTWELYVEWVTTEFISTEK